MKLAYLGTPQVAVPPLEALVEAGHDVDIVVSQPDKRRGRGAELMPSPVKQAATNLGIPVTDRVDDILGRHLDLAVVVAFGRLIKPHVLAQVPMVNLHFSLLPRWRGAAPVERAILAGDRTTGVCVMEVAEGLDEGGIYRRVEVDIDDHESVDDLRRRLVEAGTALLVSALAEGLGRPEPQTGTPTYAAKIKPEELELHWDDPTVVSLGRIRLGRAWTTWRGQRLLIHRAEAAGDRQVSAEPGTLEGVTVATGDGAVHLREVQPAGKARQNAADWARGARPQPHERLGS